MLDLIKNFMNFDLCKSLQELENSDWGEPQGDSPLEERCLYLRRVPLIEFEGIDLMRMLNHNIGIEYLIPITIELLRIDPLSDRDYYPGCLLGAILKAPYTYWKKNPKLREEVEKIYHNIPLEDDDLTKDVIKELKNSYLTFAEFGRFISLIRDNVLIQQTCSWSAVITLAIIASRQHINLEDFNALLHDTISTEMVEFLLKNKFITYEYAGPYPADRFFRLSKDFKKQLNCH